MKASLLGHRAGGGGCQAHLGDGKDRRLNVCRLRPRRHVVGVVQELAFPSGGVGVGAAFSLLHGQTLWSGHVPEVVHGLGGRELHQVMEPFPAVERGGNVDSTYSTTGRKFV